MFIPSQDGQVQGKIIHAVGSPFQGYQVEIKDYDISKTKKRYEKISLGSIHDDWVPWLDSKAQGVPAPGVSKKPLDPWAVSQNPFEMKRGFELIVSYREKIARAGLRLTQMYW
jgi:hypothetical protein